MIFRRYYQDTLWRRVFAWLPVYCEYNERGVPPCWAWLRWVWRKDRGQRTPEPHSCYALPWKKD